MWCFLRRHSVVLLWLALVLLPLRGWAFAGMQAQAPADAPHAVVASACHGAALSIDPPAAEAAAGHGCAMCDVCHAVAVPVAVAPFGDNYLPPQVAVTEPLPLAGTPQAFFRPPRA